MANPLRVTKTYKYIERKEKEKKEIRYRDTSCLLYTSKADVNARKAGNTEDGATAGSEDSLSAEITRGLGGSANIEDVDCCATRLRCTVSNPDLVNDGILKATGASGVVHRGRCV